MLDIDYFYIEVGAKIRETRERAGFSQQRLAELVNLSRTSITNIEAGRQRLMLHTLVSIAAVLKIEVSNLLPEENTTLEKELSRLPEKELAWVRSTLGQVEKGEE